MPNMPNIYLYGTYVCLYLYAKFWIMYLFPIPCNIPTIDVVQVGQPSIQVIEQIRPFFLNPANKKVYCKSRILIPI